MTLTRRATLQLVLAAALAAGSGSALAQGRWRERPLSPQQREQLREQVDSARRDAYRQRREAQPPARQLTPAQREQLRRDIQDANRDLERRRRR